MSAAIYFKKKSWFWKIKTMSKTTVDKLQPMDQIYPQSVFVNKVLLEQNHACLFMYCL